MSVWCSMRYDDADTLKSRNIFFFGNIFLSCQDREKKNTLLEYKSNFFSWLGSDERLKRKIWSRICMRSGSLKIFLIGSNQNENCLEKHKQYLLSMNASAKLKAFIRCIAGHASVRSSFATTEYKFECSLSFREWFSTQALTFTLNQPFYIIRWNISSLFWFENLTLLLFLSYVTRLSGCWQISWVHLSHWSILERFFAIIV